MLTVNSLNGYSDLQNSAHNSLALRPTVLLRSLVGGVCLRYAALASEWKTKRLPNEAQT